MQEATQSQPDFIPADPDFIPAEEQKKSVSPSGGGIRDFANRALGVPYDVFEHPNKWLNPFSREYWSPQHSEEAVQSFQPSTRMTMPGRQTYQDIREKGLFSGAVAGDIAPGAVQLATIPRFGSAKLPAPPNVYEGPVPAEIPAGRPTGTRDLSAVPSLLRREVTGKVPFLSRFESTKKPTFSEWHEALTARKTPTEAPVYGNTPNAELRGPYEPLKADLSVQPSEPAPQPAPRNAPIRGESQNLQTFRESTPAEIEANASRLAANRAARVKIAPAESGQVPFPEEAVQYLKGEAPASEWPPAAPRNVIKRAAQQTSKSELADRLETKGIQEQLRRDLEEHGHSAYSQEKRDWFARNQPGSTKGELTSQTPPVTAVPPPKPQITINPENLRTILKRGNIPQGQIPRVLGREGSYLLEEGDLANHPRIPEPGEDLSEILQQSINKVKAQKSRAAKASQ